MKQSCKHIVFFMFFALNINTIIPIPVEDTQDDQAAKNSLEEKHQTEKKEAAEHDEAIKNQLQKKQAAKSIDAKKADLDKHLNRNSSSAKDAVREDENNQKTLQEAITLKNQIIQNVQDIETIEQQLTTNKIDSNQAETQLKKIKDEIARNKQELDNTKTTTSGTTEMSTVKLDAQKALNKAEAIERSIATKVESNAGSALTSALDQAPEKTESKETKDSSKKKKKSVRIDESKNRTKEYIVKNEEGDKEEYKKKLTKYKYKETSDENKKQNSNNPTKNENESFKDQIIGHLRSFFKAILGTSSTPGFDATLRSLDTADNQFKNDIKNIPTEVRNKTGDSIHNPQLIEQLNNARQNAIDTYTKSIKATTDSNVDVKKQQIEEALQLLISKVNDFNEIISQKFEQDADHYTGSFKVADKSYERTEYSTSALQKFVRDQINTYELPEDLFFDGTYLKDGTPSKFNQFKRWARSGD